MPTELNSCGERAMAIESTPLAATARRGGHPDSGHGPGETVR